MNSERPSYLIVELGDIVMEISTKRLAHVTKKTVFGSKNGFYATWMNDGTRALFLTRKQHSTIKKTGENINDSDSESD